MFMERSEITRSNKKERKYKIASIVILANLILCTLSCGLYKYNMDQTIVSYNNYKDARRDAEWDVIEMYINEMYNNLEKELLDITVDLEISIISDYDNLDDLEKEFSKEDYSHLYSIIEEKVKNTYLTPVKNDNNDLFVAVRDGIFMDYSISQIPYYSDTKTEDFRTWEEYINSSINPTLTRKAVDLILNQSNDVIFNQIDGDQSFYSQQLKELKKIYKEKGLEELKNFVFLVPAYITDDGDILGNLDIMYGHKYNTYKIILVQEFNIYDQLKVSYPSLVDEDRYKYLDIQQEQLIENQACLGMLIVLEVFACIVLSCIVFNLLFKGYRRNR